MHLRSTNAPRHALHEFPCVSSRPHLLRVIQAQKCKVAFSREYEHSHSDPFVLAQSLTAKSREFVHQHQNSSWHQHQPKHSSSGASSWAHAFLSTPASNNVISQAVARNSVKSYGQQVQQQHRHTAANSNGSWLRWIWPLNCPSSSCSSQCAGGKHNGAATASETWTDAQQQTVDHATLSSPAAAFSMGRGREESWSSGRWQDNGSDTDNSTTVVVFDSNYMTYSYSSLDDASSVVHSHAHHASSAFAIGADASFESSNSSSHSPGQQQHQQQLQSEHGRLSTAIAPVKAASSVSSSNSNGHSSSHGNLVHQSAVHDAQAFNTAQQMGAGAAAASAAATALPSATSSSHNSRRLAGSAFDSSSSSSSLRSASRRENSFNRSSSIVNSSAAVAAAAGVDDSDWLSAVLAVSTSKLSVHSNAVLTNSLKRLASLRLGSGSAAGAAVAVDGSEGLAGLLESVRARFTTFGLQHFEEVAMQLGQLGYQPDEDWLAAFERHSLSVMHGGSPRLLSRLLMARVKLSGTCSPTWCSALLDAMTAQPERLTVSSWVNALWSLVKVKHSPSRQFQAIFFSSTASRLDDVSPELLTNLVWALSRLQTAPSYLWWRSLIAATATVEKAFSHSQLASLVYSVALWAGPGGVHARDVQRLIDLLLVEVDSQLAVLQPAELTTIIWSLGSLTSSGKLIPDWELQDHLLTAVQGQLPRLNPAQLTSLCWGLAKLDHAMPEGFAEALLLEVQAQIQGFANGNLANVMWALARLGLMPSAAFRQALWEELHNRCNALALTDLSTIMWSLARFQLQPPADLLTELAQHSLSVLQEAPDDDAVAVANLIHALGQLGSRPDNTWLEAIEQLSLHILPSAGLPELVSLAKGILQMGRGPPSKGWQAAILREVRLRCRCNGIELDCEQLVKLLEELGIKGLAEGAALANQSFWDEEKHNSGYCSVQFQPGCR